MNRYDWASNLLTLSLQAEIDRNKPVQVTLMALSAALLLGDEDNFMKVIIKYSEDKTKQIEQENGN